MPSTQWSFLSHARSASIVLLAAAAALAAIAAFATAPAQAGESELYSFMGGTSDGANPQAGLILDQYGVPYGTTSYGGSSNCTDGCGTVFELMPPAPGQTRGSESVLYSFQGAPGDGAYPEAALILDDQGALYGTTQNGGSLNCPFGCGTVFVLRPPAPGQTQWTETVLYSFQGGTTDGANPVGSLVADDQGVLYGTTYNGGSINCEGGCGTVFRLTPPTAGQTEWTESVLYSFLGGTDGEYPLSGLTFDQQGALYGTTQNGGGSSNCAIGCGTVFRLTPPTAGQSPWTESVLHSFRNTPDGAYPSAGLIFDQQGALYGTTYYGGKPNCTSGCGTVFKLTPPAAGRPQWTESVLYLFCSVKNCTDGWYPSAGLVFDRRGALYGAAFGGGSTTTDGALFKLAPLGAGQAQWTESVLYSFTGAASDGANPQAGPIFDRHGALYGTTFRGGILNDGTVFRLKCSVEGGEVFGGKANLQCLRW